MTEEKHYISIWFFIGSLLGIYGVLIVGAGVYELIHPPERPLPMSQYHPAIWWGALLIALGVVYCVRFRPGRER